MLALASFHTPAPCLIERRSRRGELVSSEWRTAFVCGKGKEMVRSGPEALICCWQTDGLAHSPLWPDSWLSPPWHATVCSHCKLLLKVIHALKLHPALIEAPNRKTALQLKMRNTVFLALLIYCSPLQVFLFFSPLWTRICLKLLWFFSAPRLQWNSWSAPDLLMFHIPEVTLTCLFFVGGGGSYPEIK